MLTRFDQLKFEQHPLAKDLDLVVEREPSLVQWLKSLRINPESLGERATLTLNGLHLSVVRGKFWGVGYSARVTRDDDVVALGEGMTPPEVDDLIKWMEQQA